ncbi:hypothetical protein E1295_04000 [Nonomuraea mesophila]|uniref:Uncharacterized protein n=1 Tax=Nonomuraea mesophila TaxID=2530382 RepID=A0A4R5FXJ0_9ACTN|nr:hypothetical protein [Nonomuraea mesophila]TDE59074.1 hypothetical protein E1295_04000 [Nonomuraea mesophila]
MRPLAPVGGSAAIGRRLGAVLRLVAALEQPPYVRKLNLQPGPILPLATRATRASTARSTTVAALVPRASPLLRDIKPLGQGLFEARLTYLTNEYRLYFANGLKGSASC